MAERRKKGFQDKYTRKYIKEHRFVERYLQFSREGYHDAAIAGCLEISKATLYRIFEKYEEMAEARELGSALRERWWFEFGRSAAAGKIPGFNSLVYVWMTKNVLKWKNEDRVVEVQAPAIEMKDVKYVTDWGSKNEPSDPEDKAS